MIKINVAIGIIVNEQNTHVYLTKRTKKQHLAGFWEFPGGKIESYETPELGLKRELKEELNINVTSSSSFVIKTYDYEDRSIKLNCFIVERFKGKVAPQESQEGQWFSIKDLSGLKMPEANTELVSLFLKQIQSY